MLLADLVISHIESALPEILERLELPAKMSAEKRYIEQARLRGTGFRQSSKTARRLIAARLNQESKLDAIRQVREQIRTTVQLTSKGSTSSESPAQEVFTRELEAYKKAIEGLADLTVEQESLDKLKDALEALAQPKSIVEKLKAGAECAEGRFDHRYSRFRRLAFGETCPRTEACRIGRSR